MKMGDSSEIETLEDEEEEEELEGKLLLEEVEKKKKKNNHHHQQQQQQHRQEEEEEDEGEDENDAALLKFMDSVDNYLTLMDSLSSTLRQGWMELASARHSMGSSRINTALLNLKSHRAATSLQLLSPPHHTSDAKLEQPHFTLCKWSFSESTDSGVVENGEDEMMKKFDGLRLRQQETPLTSGNNSKLHDESSPRKESPCSTDQDQVQKERHKLLAVFGALVSPKLRAAQVTFETALEVLVEIANTRSSMQLAFDKVQKDLGCNSNL